MLFSLEYCEYSPGGEVIVQIWTWIGILRSCCWLTGDGCPESDGGERQQLSKLCGVTAAQHQALQLLKQHKMEDFYVTDHEIDIK